MRAWSGGKISSNADEALVAYLDRIVDKGLALTQTQQQALERQCAAAGLELPAELARRRAAASERAGSAAAAASSTAVARAPARIRASEEPRGTGARGPAPAPKDVPPSTTTRAVARPAAELVAAGHAGSLVSVQADAPAPAAATAAAEERQKAVRCVRPVRRSGSARRLDAAAGTRASAG